MRSPQEIATMPLSEAVRLPGGNGLASPAFRLSLGLLGVIGWQHVEEGVEALICDGERVGKTRLTAEVLRLIGRRRFLRRVMLQPAPLADVRATALTMDQLQMTLVVSVKYTVTDPAHVASLQDPMSELTDALVGIVSEYIRSKRCADIVSDVGGLREELKYYLQQSPVFGQYYGVTAVLKALPSGDDRLFEIERKKRIELGRQVLVDLEGENRARAAEYDQQIAARAAQLQDGIAQRDHDRQMEMRRAELQAQTDQTLIQAISQVAAAGMDPSKALTPLIERGQQASGGEVPSHLLGRGDSPHQPQPKEGQSRVEIERAALSSIQTNGQIESFQVYGSPDRLDGATVQTSGYEIVLTCLEDYPRQAPTVEVRYRNGQVFEPKLIWIPGVSNSLAQAVASVIPQVPDEEDPGSDHPPVFRFSVGEDPREDT